MLYLLALVLLSWFSEFQAAVQLPQTESGGWITIEEETQPSIICNGLDVGSNVTWSLIHPDNTTTKIGSCGPSQTSCPSSDSNLQLSRNTKQESFLKINSGHRALIGTPVRCAQGTSNAATAKFRIITVRLPQTEDNGLITIVDDVQPSIIVCDEFDSMSSVTWSVVQPDNTVIVIGSCGSSQTICQSSDPNIALSRSVQNPESYMRIKSGHLGYTGTSVRCAQGTASAATAKLHIIRRGTISDCEYTRDTTAWRVVLKCAITDTFSSEKTYTCNWYLSPSSETQSLMTDLIRDSAEPDQQYISGQCSITRGLPTTAGVYIYSLQFYPGPVTPVTVANLTLRSPEPRLVATCPEYVAENYTLICDCITTDPGSPPSSIRWSGFNSHQLTVHNVTRHMNGTEFKCVQTWGRRMIQTLWYILRVADEYTRISGPSPFITDGTEEMTLTCSTANVELEPTFKWTGVICGNGNQDNTCTFTPSVPDDDGKIVTCTAESHQTGIAASNFNVSLYYPPSQPVIRGYATNQVLTVGDNVSLTCTVSGGKPPITDITFYCQRNGLESSAGIFDPLSSSSTVAIDLLDASDNGTVCLCIGVWRPDTTRYFRGAVSLKVAGREPMAPKVEFLAINANSNYESLTVNEGDATPVILSCAANGRPKPSIRVVRVDTGQPLEVDTSHTSGQDENVQQYMLTTSARCQDAAIYRCEASNSVGRDEKTIAFLVNCAPRIEANSQFQNGSSRIVQLQNATSESLGIVVIAYPAPSVGDIAFLGSVNGSANGAPASSVLQVTCTSTDSLYRSSCITTAESFSAGAAGLYNVTLANVFGMTSFLVDLQIAKEQEEEQEDDDDDGDAPPDQKSSNIWAYVGGGVAAGVIVVAVVVGVFIYRKCFGRDLYDRPQLRHPEPDNYTDLVLYEDIGVAQRQGGRSRSTVYENTALESPYANDRGDTGAVYENAKGIQK